MSTLTFAETHNLVVFLEKPKESNGFEEIINFLNASSIKYVLTVSPTICTTCIEHFWATAKGKTVNGERQIQALVDKKKVIIIEMSIRSDLKFAYWYHFAELERIGYENLTQKLTFYKAYFSSQWKIFIHTILQCLSAKTTAWNEFSSTMASAIICLATNQKFNFSKYIFDNMVKNLEGGVKFLMYPRFVQVFLDNQVEGMSKDKGIYVIPSHTKKVFANMKRPGKGFSGRVTPLFQTMMVQASEDMGEDSAAPTDSHSTPIILQPSSSKPQKKNLQEKVHDLEKANTAQAKEISSFKKRFKQLEKRRKSRTPGFKRLRKGRKIADLDADAEVTLVDETQEMNDDNLMFDTGVLEEQEIEFEKVVEEPVVSVATTTKSIPVSAADPVTTAGEVVTTASASVEIPDELTLAQTLIEIKTAKPKPVTTAATTVTSVRPRAKGIIFHDQEEQVPASTKTFSSSQSQLPQVKDKGKGIMEDASKQGRKIAALDADEEVTLIDETQGRNDEDLMFDTSVFEEPISVATTTSSIPVSAADLVTTAGKVVTTASAEILDELTLAQTLIKIKSIKPKVVTTTATTVTPVSTRRKAKGVVIQETGETTTTTTKIVPIPSKVQDPD
ncbi:hypothetical protein Tco_1132167 [Tanacetum coccineum]|uniref:Uncharacterized protein n=1 Tax=Tanacetum coccineum TaxID=301880 RepID=A0ABQ5JC93_9ASTR